VDEATEQPKCSDFIHDEIFSPGIVIRVLLGTNHNADVNPSARSPTARYTEPVIFFMLLYNGKSIQCA
jgi:hypothetical protein